MIISTQFFSSFFLFLLQTMENNNNKITNKKTKIMNTVKKFKEQLALHSHEITERSFKIIEIANYENEDDIEYLIDCSVYFENLFQIFLTKYNIDQISGEPLINNSTFIENPTWLARKRSVLNPHNKGNKCFQIGRNFCRISCIKPFIDNFN